MITQVLRTRKPVGYGLNIHSVYVDTPDEYVSKLSPTWTNNSPTQTNNSPTQTNISPTLVRLPKLENFQTNIGLSWTKFGLIFYTLCRCFFSRIDRVSIAKSNFSYVRVIVTDKGSGGLTFVWTANIPTGKNQRVLPMIFTGYGYFLSHLDR